MSALRIKNTSESDPRSYEVTWAVTNKAQKGFWDSTFSIVTIVFTQFDTNGSAKATFLWATWSMFRD